MFFTCPGIHERAQVVVVGGSNKLCFFLHFHTFLVGENVGLGPVLKVGTANEHKK